MEARHKAALRERGVTKYRKVASKKEAYRSDGYVRNRVFDWLQGQPNFAARAKDIQAAREKAGCSSKTFEFAMLDLGYPSRTDPRFLVRTGYGVYELYIATKINWETEAARRKKINAKRKERKEMKKKRLEEMRERMAANRTAAAKMTITKKSITKKVAKK